MVDGRVCNGCKVWYPWINFAINKKGLNDRKSICKSCSNKSQRLLAKKRREENPELVRQKRWEKHLAKQYNLTLEGLQELENLQDGKCAICKREGNPTHKDGRLYVDHCHSTGNVRGLLCYSCNTLLGFAFDDQKILKSAIDYLEKSLLGTIK